MPIESNNEAAENSSTLDGIDSCNVIIEDEEPKRPMTCGTTAWMKPTTAMQPIAIDATGPQNAYITTKRTFKAQRC